MSNRFLKLISLLLALSLLAAGLAFAEDDLEIDGDLPAEQVEAAGETGAAKLDIDGAALVSDDPAAAANASDVPINKTNFPAADFRKYVKANFDKDGNGKLSKAEAEAVLEIHLRTVDDEDAGKNKKNCPSLKGIERFPNLKKLECVECNIKTLDVSKNTKLTELDCTDNQLTKLNVTKNTALKQLQCGGNKLTALNVSKNKKLELLHCWVNRLTKLDVTKNTNLKELRFFANDVKTLDISKNTRLTHLNCGGNQLKKLDTSKNTKLVQINCYNNQLKSLDVSKNPKLIYLHTYGNKIKTIDLKNNKTIRGYLKNKIWREDKFIAWSYEGEDDLWGLSIDYGTKLTSGSKVLFEG